jgi:predicted ATPase
VDQRPDTAVLLDREAELSELVRLLDDARGGAGRLVLVEGAPGIGKTRLLDVLRRSPRSRC